MRKMIVCAIAGFAFLSPTVYAQSQDMSMLSDKRFWQGPDSQKIEERVQRRSQHALDELEKQRQPHADQFGRVSGGSRNAAGSDSAGAGGSSGGAR